MKVQLSQEDTKSIVFAHLKAAGILSEDKQYDIKLEKYDLDEFITFTEVEPETVITKVKSEEATK